MPRIIKNKPLGKHVKNPTKPVNYCDISGMFFNSEDVTKVYQWKGNKLVWTGKMAGPSYNDPPNPMNKAFEPKKEITVSENLRMDPNQSYPEPEPVLSAQELAEKA